MSDWIKTNGVPPTLDADAWVRIRWRDGMELEGPAGIFDRWGLPWRTDFCLPKS